MNKIPKIIHQIWIGDEPIPKHCLEFTEEIKKIHQDFHYVLWGNEVFEKLYKDDPFLQNYIKNPEIYKWAYIADRLRLLILRDFGGIYVDIDAKPIRSFNIILNQLNENVQIFAGMRKGNENENRMVDCTVLGAVKDANVIKEILKIYTDINWAHGGKAFSDKIMEDLLGPEIDLFNYKRFYDNKITEDTIILHDTDARLLSWK